MRQKSILHETLASLAGCALPLIERWAKLYFTVYRYIIAFFDHCEKRFKEEIVMMEFPVERFLGHARRKRLKSGGFFKICRDM
jgi:hypothetical protein